MNSVGFIAWGSGLQDGLNPCVLMTCAVFIALRLWLKCAPDRAFVRCLLFVLVYAGSFFYFTFGPGQVLVLHKQFIFTARLLYLIFSLATGVFGFLFLADWVHLRKNADVKGLIEHKIKPLVLNAPLVVLISVIVAVLFSILATLGPVNYYILLLGNEAFLKGHWLPVIPVMASYVLASLWPLFLIMGVFSIKTLPLSLVRIIFAGVFFCASTCVIFII